ncbi:MAG: hypothetical protein ACTSXZ_11175, partial [Alphaproteobacteria bacterium]
MKQYATAFGLFIATLAAMKLFTPFLGVVDDAWITYTYARNLAAGHGISFNPPELVEGCTAFLHMVLLAPFAWFTTRLDIVAVLLNLLAWAGVAVLAWSFIRRRDGGRVGVLGLFAVAFIVAGLSGLAWTYAGMEMPLVALAWLGAAKLHLRERETGAWPWVSALVTVAAGLLRPDGILVAVPLALSTWYAGERKFAWRKALVYSAIVIGLFGGYWLWRWHYFGYPLPNTFYAKVTETSAKLSSTGVKYTLRWLFGMVVPLLAVLAMLYARKQRPVPRWVRLMTGLVLTSIGYVLLVGSDFFSYHRFLLPSYAPLVLVAWWYGVGVNIRRRKDRTSRMSRGGKIAVMVVFFLILQANYFIWPSKPANQPSRKGQSCLSLFYPPQGLVHKFIVENTRDWRQVGAELRRSTPDGAKVATIAIGALSYFSHRYVLDMLGLTDVHIAHTDVPTGEAITGHEKYDLDYVLERAPELIYTWPGLMPPGKNGVLKWVMSNIG